MQSDYCQKLQYKGCICIGADGAKTEVYVHTFSHRSPRLKGVVLLMPPECDGPFSITLCSSLLSLPDFVLIRHENSDQPPELARSPTTTPRNNRKGGTACLRSRKCVKRNAVFGAHFKGLSLFFLYHKSDTYQNGLGYISDTYPNPYPPVTAPPL